MSNSSFKISNLISTQVPFFVRNDHENFMRFLELYYEYLEQYESKLEDGKVVERSKNLLSYMDIDRSIDGFVEKFYDIYIKLIPKTAIADKNIVLKHVKDFYGARGTEKSIKFLMRILFNEEDVEFYYPKRDVLRASDGKWFVEKSLKIENVKVDGVSNNSIDVLKNYPSRKIYGNTSGAYATVERVDSYFENGVPIYELKISNQYKNFQSGETIFTLFDENNQTRSLTASLFPGYLNLVTIDKPGTGYKIGDVVKINSEYGNGGIVIVSSVTTGNISGFAVIESGAGFNINDSVLVSGGGGSGALGYISNIDNSGKEHPNSYIIPISTIGLEANTAIGNTLYSNLSLSNANTQLINSFSFFTYSNTGPIISALIGSSGSGYSSIPIATPTANTVVRSLGILGKMKIVNGGVNYANGDIITFTNVIGGYGSGAAANVKTVDANGTIQQVQFIPVPGQITGGIGYSMETLPIATVVSATGSNADIKVTAVLGDGSLLQSLTETGGKIKNLTVVSRGLNYDANTTLDLTKIGNGDAKARISVITGTYSYPGRYINDDGHLSGYNFLEDRDYYQNFSYVVKLKQSIEKYRKALKEIIHPAGTTVFGEYLFVDNNVNTEFQGVSSLYNDRDYIGTYNSASNANGTLVSVLTTANVKNATSSLYVEFLTSNNNNIKNLSNGIYKINATSTNSFTFYLPNTMIGTVSANAGNGNTNILTGSSTAFDVLNIGDMIRISGNSNIFYVGSINSATKLSVTKTLPPNIIGNTFYRVQNSANSNGTILFSSV